jgi:hypothetical protein
VSACGETSESECLGKWSRGWARGGAGADVPDGAGEPRCAGAVGAGALDGVGTAMDRLEEIFEAGDSGR